MGLIEEDLPETNLQQGMFLQRKGRLDHMNRKGAIGIVPPESSMRGRVPVI